MYVQIENSILCVFINMTDYKIDIDPKTMVDFMDKCVDIDRTDRNGRRPWVVGPAPKCIHSHYTFCDCKIVKIHAKWKDVKYIHIKFPKTNRK